MACEAGKECGKVKLIYFNARGRAELARWILSYGKADWEDCRLTADEWAKCKPNMPLGQLPVIECEKDGKKKQVTQSATIVRALAHRFGLAGKTPCECVNADEAMEVIREIAMLGAEMHFEQDAARKEKLCQKLKTEVCPRNFCFLEKRLQANGGKFLAGGDCFTYADLAIACLCDGMQKRGLAKCDEMKAKCPGLCDLACRVKENPEIKAYLAKRPDTEM